MYFVLNFKGFFCQQSQHYQTPPSPFVSACKHLPDPPPPFVSQCKHFPTPTNTHFGCCHNLGTAPYYNRVGCWLDMNGVKKEPGFAMFGKDTFTQYTVNKITT